jgi:hypothetical protein
MDGCEQTISFLGHTCDSFVIEVTYISQQDSCQCGEKSGKQPDATMPHPTGKRARFVYAENTRRVRTRLGTYGPLRR